jgi:hypothetical protein
MRPLENVFWGVGRGLRARHASPLLVLSPSPRPNPQKGPERRANGLIFQPKKRQGVGGGSLMEGAGVRRPLVPSLKICPSHNLHFHNM